MPIHVFLFQLKPRFVCARETAFLPFCSYSSIMALICGHVSLDTVMSDPPFRIAGSASVGATTRNVFTTEALECLATKYLDQNGAGSAQQSVKTCPMLGPNYGSDLAKYVINSCGRTMQRRHATRRHFVTKRHEVLAAES